jgi:hypothetical protein
MNAGYLPRWIADRVRNRKESEDSSYDSMQ